MNKQIISRLEIQRTTTSEIRCPYKINDKSSIGYCGRYSGTQCHPKRLSVSEPVVEPMFDAKGSNSDDVDYICVTVKNNPT